MMSWNELVERLCGLRRFGIEPGLCRIKRALQREGSPQQGFDVVNVAGTNGKGTVASLTAAILQAHGLRVGLYTSPHLVGIRERFRVDGRPLGVEAVEPVLKRVVRRYEPETGTSEVDLTFFECTTLAAAMLFEHKGVDVGVFEVGLGGRLDAVNAIDPSVAVITSIGRDHTEYLGEEIAEIAGEKAGILRKDTPAVVAPQEHGEAREVLVREAGVRGANAQLVEAPEEAGEPGEPVGGLLETAHTAARAFLAGRWRREAATRGVSRWRWPGRFEQLSGGGEAELFLDVAHNAAALRVLRRVLQRRDFNPDAVVWGGMADKDVGQIDQFFRWLGAPVWGAVLEGDRARDEAQLKRFVPVQLWQGAGPAPDVLRAACGEVRRVLVFGSVFLIGEVYRELGRGVDSLVSYSSPAG